LGLRTGFGFTGESLSNDITNPLASLVSPIVSVFMVLRVSIVEEVIISCSSTCPAAAAVGGSEGLPMTPLGGRFEEGEPRLLLSLSLDGVLKSSCRGSHVSRDGRPDLFKVRDVLGELKLLGGVAWGSRVS